MFGNYKVASYSGAYLWFALTESVKIHLKDKASNCPLSSPFNITLACFTYLSSHQRSCHVTTALCGPPSNTECREID